MRARYTHAHHRGLRAITGPDAPTGHAHGAVTVRVELLAACGNWQLRFLGVLAGVTLPVSRAARRGVLIPAQCRPRLARAAVQNAGLRRAYGDATEGDGVLAEQQILHAVHMWVNHILGGSAAPAALAFRETERARLLQQLLQHGTRTA